MLQLVRNSWPTCSFELIFQKKGSSFVIYKTVLRIHALKQPFSDYLFCLWWTMFWKLVLPQELCWVLPYTGVDQIWEMSSCTGLCAVLARLAEWKPPLQVPHRLPRAAWRLPGSNVTAAKAAGVQRQSGDGANEMHQPSPVPQHRLPGTAQTTWLFSKCSPASEGLSAIQELS